MFIRGGSAHVRRPTLALGLAFSACFAVAAASHAFNTHAVTHDGAPITLAYAGATFDALDAAPADVWIMIAPGCDGCARALTNDAPSLRAAGVTVRVLQTPPEEAALTRLLGVTADAAESEPGARLRQALRRQGLEGDAPIFIWRDGEGAWRCLSGQEEDAADRILSELKARA